MAPKDMEGVTVRAATQAEKEKGYCSNCGGSLVKGHHINEQVSINEDGSISRPMKDIDDLIVIYNGQVFCSFHCKEGRRY